MRATPQKTKAKAPPGRLCYVRGYGAGVWRYPGMGGGLSRTEMGDGVQGNDARTATFVAGIPPGRLAEPRGIGDVLAILALDDAGFATALNLPVNEELWALKGHPPQA